ncbi:tetratricopeptide repeat protein [Methylorubrum thiocyanatum]
MKALAGILGVLAALFGSSASAQVAQGIKAYAQGDYTTAMRAFEAGAAKGDPQALYNLGVACAEGRAMPADPARAIDYYRRAAEGGSVLAAFNLGQAYRKGQGVAADPTQAARWYEQAAKGGHYKAGNELGILYIEGRGVPRDPIEGMAWIYPATHASIMDSSAMANAIQAAGLLDRAQIQEAQARGQTYFRRYIAPNRAVVRALSGG